MRIMWRSFLMSAKISFNSSSLSLSRHHSNQNCRLNLHPRNHHSKRSRRLNQQPTTRFPKINHNQLSMSWNKLRKVVTLHNSPLHDTVQSRHIGVNTINCSSYNIKTWIIPQIKVNVTVSHDLQIDWLINSYSCETLVLIKACRLLFQV